jgi:hypothetical protein
MERRASPTLCGHFIELGLYSLIVDFVADISGAAFTGLALLDNNPDFLQDLWIFDESSNALLTGVPAAVPRVRKARTGRHALSKAMEELNRVMWASMEGEHPRYK